MDDEQGVEADCPLSIIDRSRASSMYLSALMQLVGSAYWSLGIIPRQFHKTVKHSVV